jgi:hypothetical protein
LSTTQQAVYFVILMDRPLDRGLRFAIYSTMMAAFNSGPDDRVVA